MCSALTFLGTARPMATAGVEQNRPTLTPGVAKVDFSVTTAMSQLATSWQPAAVATPFTMAMTGTGMSCIRVITWNTPEGELFVRIKLLWFVKRNRGDNDRNSPLHRCETPLCDTLCPESTSAPSGRVRRKTLDLWLTHTQHINITRLYWHVYSKSHTLRMNNYLIW